MVTKTGERPVVGHHREKIYPFDDVGSLIECGSEAWGAPSVVVPVDGIFRDYGWEASGPTVPYNMVGFNIISVADPSIQCTLQLLRIYKPSVQVLDEDSGSGQAGEEKRIHVPFTGGYAVGDYVWVRDDTSPNGEIAEIAAIVTDDYLEAAVNLTGDYDVDTENAAVYLVRRGKSSCNRSIWTSFSSATTKEMLQIRLHASRHMDAGDGILARGRSTEAGTPDVNLSIVYDDS